MQESRASSTLELVVNEQQMQNMSRIDLRPNDSSGNNNAQGTGQDQPGSILDAIRSCPTRFSESFRAKLDEAKAKSDSKCEFALEVISVFSGTIIWTLCFLFTILMPVILFIIGLVNLDDCADRPTLPYLIFSMGFVMTASNLFNLALSLDIPVLKDQHILTADVKNVIASILNIIFNCVVAFLYTISGYMVFTIGTRNGSKENPTSSSANAQAPGFDDGGIIVNCNATLYNFSFWFMAITLSLSAIIIALALLLFAYNKYRLAIIRGSTPRSQTETPSLQIGSISANRV